MNATHQKAARQPTCYVVNEKRFRDHLFPLVPHMYYMFMFMFLQLLDEFMTYVAAIERLAFHSRRWRTTKIGDSIPNVESHAAAIILVVMKLLFGLDENSEFKISEFAEKANQILKLEPATNWPQPDRSPANSTPQYSGKMKTLFVWEEWVRWIRYRRLVLDSTHVPTAVQHNTVSKMDPDIVIRFVESHGHYLSHRKKTRKSVISASEEIQRIIDDYVMKHQVFIFFLLHFTLFHSQY